MPDEDGAENDDGGAQNDDGAVNVIYGTASGLSSLGDQLWSQDNPGIVGVAESGDGFGRVVGAIGDCLAVAANPCAGSTVGPAQGLGYVATVAVVAP